MEKVYTIDDLMQAIKESGRSYDTDRIMAAYQVAKEAHKDQRRRSGEPYISHPVAVAIILVGLGMDTETLPFCTMWWRILPLPAKALKSSSAKMWP